MRQKLSGSPASDRRASLLPARHRAKAVRLSAAFALVALGSATALSEGVLQSSVAAAVQNARDLIASRSPGLRTRADMSKGKPQMAAAAPARTARALPRVRDARSSTAGPAIAAPAEETFAPFVAPGEPVPGVVLPVGGPVDGAAPGGGGGPILFSPVPGPGIIGGGPAGGVIIGPNPEPTPTPEPTPPVVVNPPAPVPEPASWATMILGFFAVGWTLRRRSHVQAVV